MTADFQTTIADAVTVRGIGVHSGSPARLTLHPADPDKGIVFRLPAEAGPKTVLAFHANVRNTQLCTVLGDDRGATVSTVEHVMAALAGLAIDNVTVEVDGPEVPIMDGSSRAFVAAIDEVGVVAQPRRRRVIRVLKPVRVEDGRAFAELSPGHDPGFELDVTIDFETPLIGRQRFVLSLTPENFRREIAAARTFGFVREAEALRKMGLARGSSLDNSVALADDGILNPEGLRWRDEFVRHKLLDAIGDLALAGSPIEGRFTSCRGGHRMNNRVLEALFADPSNYTVIEPPARRDSGHARAAARLAMPAFGPDI